MCASCNPLPKSSQGHFCVAFVSCVDMYCFGRLQEVLGDETATQVAVNFFGDGTCNVGEPLPLSSPAQLTLK